MKRLIAISMNDAMYLLACIVLAGITLIGIPLAYDPSTPFGHYRLTTIPTGLSLYQLGGNHRYYQISAAYDDITTDAGTHKLTPWLDPGPWSLIGHMRNVATVMGTLITPSALTTTFETPTGPITYTPTIQGNTLTVGRTIRSVSPITQVTTSLSYARDDIVLDNTGTVYTENPDTLLTTLQQLLNIPLTKHGAEERITYIPTGTLIVINPAIPGSLVVQASPTQRLFVNKNTHVISLEEQPAASIPMRTTMTISTYNTMEALREIL